MFGNKVVCALASAAILAGATNASLACKGSTVLFKDDFSKVNKAWGGTTNGFSISAGKMLGQSQQGYVAWAIYNAKFFPDADFCADIIMPQASDTQDKWAGLTIVVPDGVYWAHITLDGGAGVEEATQGSWLSPIPVAPNDAVKTDPGAVNTLRLVWKSSDPSVSFYVNDKLIDAFDGPNSKARKIGLGFQTNGDPQSVFTVKNVVVTKP